MWFWILLGLGGAFVAGVALASESERRREIGPGKPPPRLLTDVARHVQMTSSATALGGLEVYTLCQLYIRPGVESFTPPLPKGKRVKLIFTGACAVKRWDSPWCGLDACYTADTYDHNYKHRHYKLLLDQKTPATGPIEEDRAEHRYVFVYEATGGRLAVLLEPPIVAIDPAATTGSIQLCVVSLTQTEEAALGFDREARKREAERANRALELAVLAHLESNFVDPEYQKNYAASHVPHILHHDSKEWLAEYKEVIGDPELYALIESEHPHVLEFLEARLEIVRIAQRLAVKPPPKPKEPEGKRRLSREEWEMRIERYRQRQLDRLRVQAEDHIAKQLQKLELAQELRERAQQLNLDEDDIERLVQQLLGDLDDADEDAGKGFQQL
jgi:hypothetical protein